MTDDQAPPPDPVAVMQNTQATWLELPASWPDGRDLAKRLTEMLASRYSGQLTQRDLDVAKVAYAAGAKAERERIREVLIDHDAWYQDRTQPNSLRKRRAAADLIRARTTP